MIVLLPLLRKLSVRSRTIVGAAVTAVGLVAIVVAVAGGPAIGLDGAIAAVVGLIFLASAWSSRRRERSASAGPAVPAGYRSR